MRSRQGRSARAAGTTIAMTAYSYQIGSAAAFNAVLTRIDVGGDDAGTGNTYTFTLTGDIVLDRQLYAVNLQGGTAGGDVLTIDGGGHTLDGANAYNGLFVYDGTVDIRDLTLANTVATGGSSLLGGGGAGLGGGLFVAGPNATAVGSATMTAGGNVTLTNVGFSGNRAVGGSVGNNGVGGGGLNGGPVAGSGGGGVGTGAFGGSGGGGPGLILGAASGGGTTGGANGGGGRGDIPLRG